MSLSTNDSRPGDAVNIKVRTTRGSCVCVSTVDKSAYLLGNGFKITPEKVSYYIKVYWNCNVAYKELQS